MKELISKEQLRRKVKSLARRIDADYQGKNPLLVAILKGSFVFVADLVRNLTIDHEVDFMVVSSYGKSKSSSGVVRMVKDLHQNIEGRHVLLVEDIFDTGYTLGFIMKTLLLRNPASLEVISLLDKKVNKKADIAVKYVGFEIPDVFVVGYGLDFNQHYRNLPYVAVLDGNVAARQRKATRKRKGSTR